MIIMLSAVHLDHQHRFQADKVEDVILERVLSSEFVSIHLPPPQALP